MLTPFQESYYALEKEVLRLRDALEWIVDHSNDPAVVRRARDELEK